MVKTRPGLQNVFTAIGGNPSINYLKTYITQTQLLRMLALDSLGNIYKENPIGTLASIGTSRPQSGSPTGYSTVRSVSQFAREYLAFSDGKFGFDIPRQYDDTNLDRISQCGPGAPPVATDEPFSDALSTPGSQEVSVNIAASPNGLSESGTTVTVTVAGGSFLPNGLAVGDTINITGAGVAGYNGQWVVSSIAPPGTSFTYTNTVSGLAASGNGSVQTLITIITGASNLPFTILPPGGSKYYLAGQPSGLPQVVISGSSVAAYNSTWTVRYGGGTTFNVTLTVSAGFGLAAGNAGTLTVAGNIPAGKHGLTVIFQTRQGYRTAPAPPTSWTAAGSKRVTLTQIATGPPNVTARILAFTLTGGNSYFYITTSAQIFSASMIIPDNTTTSITIDFNDSILAGGTNVDYLFKMVELAECSGIIDYALRNFYWGERNKVQNVLNFSFCGGFGTDQNSLLYPLGWTEDTTFYAGGGDAVTNYPALPVVWGNAYSITGDGATGTRGLMNQSMYQDINGVPIIQANTAYSIRIRAARNNTLAAGRLRVHLVSAQNGIDAGVDVTAAQATTTYQEFTASLTTGIATPAVDLVLKVYADQTPTNGGVFLLGLIQVYPTNQPYLTSLVRGSRIEDPESLDGVKGIMQYGELDGTRVTNAFKLRNNLYFVKERSLWRTADDGINEPAQWTIDQISTLIGTPSVNGVGVGSDWVVIAGRNGLYFFDGGEPEKISQEIQKAVVTETGALKAGWDNINWQYGHTLWVLVDERQRRIMVGAPTFSATTPNVVFVLDYRGLDTGKDITAHKSVHISAYTGKIYDIADSRKWTRWNMSINSSALIERTDGTAHTFMGNGTGTGKIYDLLDVENFTTPSQFGDDGASINSYYDTYYFLRPQEEEQYQMGSHRKLYRYLSMYLEGQGIPTLSAFPPGDFAGIGIPQSGISLPSLGSPLFPVNISSISRTGGIVTVITASAHNVTTAVVIQGTGNAAFDNKTFGNVTVVSYTSFKFPLAGADIAVIANTGTVSLLIRDLEIPVDIHAERTKFRVQTNAVGAFFSLRTLTPSIMSDPWAPIRGVN